MTKLRKLFYLLKLARRDTRGNAAMEYAFIASGVALVAIVSWTTLGNTLSTTFTDVANYVNGTSSAASSAESSSSSESSNNDNDSDSDS